MLLLRLCLMYSAVPVPYSILSVLSKGGSGCEHLIEVCARWVETLLNALPDLFILATSRETFGINGETISYLAPLSVPSPSALLAPEDLVHYSATALFLEYARQEQLYETGLRLANALWWFWILRADFAVGHTWLERVALEEKIAPALRGLALYRASPHYILWRQTMHTFSEPREEAQRFSARLIALSWQEGRLVPQIVPAATEAKAARITILHTNDLHSSVDGRTDETGKQRGGLARVATTVRRARAVGPTLVFDVGDIVFGDGTWWDIQGIEPVAFLRARAGCDLATIGNHDLEHGINGLRELLTADYPLVSANLRIADDDIQRQIAPAYLIEIGGWRIGVTGLTTLATFDLIPARILQGITLADPYQTARQVVDALNPWVDSIVVLSHLGFYPDGPGDVDLAAHLAGSKVSVILGAHTHAARQPARSMDGITLCNAGAYSANVGEVVLSFCEDGMLDVQTRLLLQDETLPADPLWLEAREQIAQTFQSLHTTVFSLSQLPPSTGQQWGRVREWTLLARALRARGDVPLSAVLMVPLLYVVGQLPENEQVTLAEVMTTYPNSEYLVLLEVAGKILKKLILLQETLLYYQQARPFRLQDETEVRLEQVEEEQLYTLITSELIRDGGLGWGLSPALLGQSGRSLNTTCLQIVSEYLIAQ